MVSRPAWFGLCFHLQRNFWTLILPPALQFRKVQKGQVVFPASPGMFPQNFAQAHLFFIYLSLSLKCQFPRELFLITLKYNHVYPNTSLFICFTQCIMPLIFVYLFVIISFQWNINTWKQNPFCIVHLLLYPWHFAHHLVYSRNSLNIY